MYLLLKMAMLHCHVSFRGSSSICGFEFPRYFTTFVFLYNGIIEEIPSLSFPTPSPQEYLFLLIRFFPKSRLFFHNKSCGFCSKLEKTVKAMWKNTTRESSFGCSSYVESKGGKLSGKTEASSRWDAATGMTGWIRMEGMDDWLVVLNLCYFHPYLVKIPNLTHIFPMGWNH